ncbi:hypothetical protein EDD22DRAFT_852356 [Suillus occidentalis]|nr:hypothetical protein EDD22DRAFT_852356 [Suillus occidentalis]
MINIPPDWALATTHIASKYVSHQFLAMISGWPNAIPPLELDFMMAKGINPVREDSLLARYPPDSQIHLDRLAVMCDKFGIIIFWYLPGAIDGAIQNDMAAATKMMSVPLARSVTSSAATSNNWRTHASNFYSSQSGGTPGCINLSLAWFMQGHPVPKFHPQVSATLKEVEGQSFCQAMHRLAVLIAAALRVMHPNLYWSSLAVKLALGLWADQNKSNKIGDHLREWPLSS